jgi:hypothetical protein
VLLADPGGANSKSTSSSRAKNDSILVDDEKVMLGRLKGFVSGPLDQAQANPCRSRPLSDFVG